MNTSISENDDRNRPYDEEKTFPNQGDDHITSRNNSASRSSSQHENSRYAHRQDPSSSGINQITSHERIKSLVTLAPMNMDNLPSNPFSNSFGSGHNQSSSAQKANTPSNSDSNGNNGISYGLNNEYGGIPRQNFTMNLSKDQSGAPITAFYESKYKPNITPVNDVHKPNISNNVFSEPFNPFNATIKTNNDDNLLNKASGKKCFLCNRDVISTSNGLDFDICRICKKQ